MSQSIELKGTVEPHQTGKRLDAVLAELFTDYSRTRLKDWVLEGHVLLDGKVCQLPKEKVMEGQLIEITTEVAEDTRWQAQDIPLNIVYEDEHLLVIDKPAGLVVHPGAGTPDGTVLNALLHRYPEIAEVPRAGIVHRLDKETTGLMVVAKTIPAQIRLVYALQKRRITREYEAIVVGHMTAGGSVNEPISRHSTQRTMMAVNPMGKPATTHYRVAERFRAHTRLRLRLETGRTHQIRVHMSHINHALVGDPVYGGRLRPVRNASKELSDFLRTFRRQALHATMLRLIHPITGEEMEWHSPIPADMVELIDVLRIDSEEHPDDIVWI